PLLGAGHPRVVDGGAGLAEDEVLDPVGARPAGVAAGLDADAPLLGVARGGRAGGGVELVPGLGSGARPVLGVVPDQALDGTLGEDTDELAVGCLAECREAGRGRRLIG